jgi:hypothetical protein
MAYPVGRPATKPTQDQIDIICKSVADGNCRETAVAFAGISPGIVRNWIRAGKKDIDAGDDTVEAQFVTRFLKCEAEAEMKSISAIRDRGQNGFVTSSSEKGETTTPPDWRAEAWWLERRGAKNWGVKKSLEISVGRDRERLLEIAEQVLDADQFDKLLAAFVAAEDAESSGLGEDEASSEASG